MKEAWRRIELCLGALERRVCCSEMKKQSLVSCTALSMLCSSGNLSVEISISFMLYN